MVQVVDPLDEAGVAGQVRCALGKEPADLVIKGARVVNVFTQAVEEPGCVAVKRGRVVSLGPELAGWIGPDTAVEDAGGQYLIPGLIDAHTHLDSIFLAAEYARWALPRGNTLAVTEMAMMAGAWGVSGLRALLEEAAHQPMRMFFTAPPLTPPFPDLETSAGLAERDFFDILERADCLGIGEAYWPAVTDGDPRIGRYFARAWRLGKVMDGHAAGAKGDKLMAYTAGGVTSCHEAITGPEAIERLRLGLAVQVRQGFVRKEMPEVAPALKDLAETGNVMLVTDLAPPDELVEKGAMNPLLSEAVALGVPAPRAVAWCSINPARYLGLDRLGAVAPGYAADLVLVKDLVGFEALAVWLGGELVARNGRLVEEKPGWEYPPQARRTMLNPEITERDLAVPARGDSALARVCNAKNGTITTEEHLTLPVRDGSVRPDPGQDVVKLAHINRHSPELKMAVGFAKGWGFRSGAMATSMMWDTNNLMVMGAGEAEMVLAANRVRELGGGIVVVDGQTILAELPLPIAGVISPRPMGDIITMMREVEEAMRKLGCGLENPVLASQTFCFTGLPFLRLTDKGLVDVRTRGFVDVVLG